MQVRVRSPVCAASSPTRRARSSRADQEQLPRGPVGARVLHLDARRAQGSRRHRVAYCRLRLPHASTRRRRAGADRARGRLRHGPRHLGRRRATWRRELALCSRRGLLGRCLAEDVTLADGTVIPRSTEVDDDPCLLADDPGHHRFCEVRSVLTCETVVGRLLGLLRPHARNRQDLRPRRGDRYRRGQSIGEPGTQLTMRTFHTGGVAGEDITHSLPGSSSAVRGPDAEERSLMADVSGVVRIGENDKGERRSSPSSPG